MRYAGAGLIAHYAGTELTLAVCLKITQRDSVVISLTDHDQDLVVSGTTYRSAYGFEMAELRRSPSIEDDATVIEGLIVSAATGIKEISALAGKLLNAVVEIFEVNWQDTTQVMPLKYGRITQVQPKGSFFSLSIEGLSSKLTRGEVLEKYITECQADFGDARCGIAVANAAGTITAVTDSITLVASAFGGPGTAGYYSYGKIVINSIPWAVNQIKSYTHATKTFVLALPLPLVSGSPQVGDTFTAYQGCDKRASTCKTTFSNLVNFRGFPFVPDRDAAGRTFEV